MSAIWIPSQLASGVDEDDCPARREWLTALPELIAEIASDWALELGEPYLPGGQAAWVAPARDPSGAQLVLKVGWRHWEAEHEGEALAHWNGQGAVRCHGTRTLEDTSALLLEQCVPGTQLRCSTPEPDQDVVAASLLRRVWERQPDDDHPFASLQMMCDDWADSLELDFATDPQGMDPGLAREGIAMLRELPGSANRSVLLCTDLHAGNILAAEREPWLMIDPKPFVGDPAYDAVQHMLNCDERLATDPAGLSRRMAELLELEPNRVRLWLFARCAHESLHDATMREPARRLAP